MNLLLFEPAEITSAGSREPCIVRVEGARARHLLTVLKVSPGQPVRVGIADGPLGRATVTDVADASVTLRCTFDAQPPPRPRVDLLLALPRPKVMRRLWAQLSALGVGRIILTNAARVERHYFDTHILALEIYRPLLVEGLQQARDTRLPQVTIHRQFRPLVEDDLDTLAGSSLRIVADPRTTSQVGEVCREGASDGSTRALIAIGPEGGWNEFELSLLEQHRFRRASMGTRTLRTDTACVALLALVHANLKRFLE